MKPTIKLENFKDTLMILGIMSIIIVIAVAYLAGLCYGVAKSTKWGLICLMIAIIAMNASVTYTNTWRGNHLHKPSLILYILLLIGVLSPFIFGVCLFIRNLLF